MNTAIAYVVAFLFIGAAGGIAGALVALGALTKIGKPGGWSVFGGVIGAMFSYWLGLHFFQWIGVHFGWYSYLTSMFLVIINDGSRASREGPDAIGINSSHATGTMLGMVASLTTHFLR